MNTVTVTYCKLFRVDRVLHESFRVCQDFELVLAALLGVFIVSRRQGGCIVVSRQVSLAMANSMRTFKFRGEV